MELRFAEDIVDSNHVHGQNSHNQKASYGVKCRFGLVVWLTALFKPHSISVKRLAAS
jgi:hypothetical protein